MLPTHLLRAATTKVAEIGADAYQRAVERKWRIVSRHVGKSGVYTGVTKRVLVPKKILAEKDLVHHLGFVPDPLAIPEAGQKRITSYRHPLHEYHLHDHGDVWAVHKDEHPAANMLIIRANMEAAAAGGEAKRVPLTATLRQAAKGIPHALREGAPAFAAYLRGRILREPGMKELVAIGLPQQYLREVGKMQPSKYASVSLRKKIIGSGAVTAPSNITSIKDLPDPLSNVEARPRVSGLPVPRRSSLKFSPHDKGLQKGSTPVNPFSGNRVKI